MFSIPMVASASWFFGPTPFNRSTPMSARWGNDVTGPSYLALESSVANAGLAS